MLHANDVRFPLGLHKKTPRENEVFLVLYSIALLSILLYFEYRYHALCSMTLSHKLLR